MILKVIENIFTLMGMYSKYCLGELLHMFKRFLEVFYEMVVVVTKEGNVLVFRERTKFEEQA